MDGAVESVNYRVIGLVPVADEDGVITGRVVERDRNPRPAEDSEAAEAAGRLVEVERREVEEAADLIFHLEFVRGVSAWWYGACCSQDTVHV